jgi:hypothetical protein
MHDDPTHLTVRPYTPDDAAMVAEWWNWRESSTFPVTILPPLGVIVCDESGPTAALWCYECYGVGVAMLEGAIARPMLSLAQSTAAFKLAVQACIEMAGKSVEPPAEFRVFRAFTVPSIARILRQMGFESGETQCVSSIFYNPN